LPLNGLTVPAPLSKAAGLKPESKGELEIAPPWANAVCAQGKQRKDKANKSLE
jgi:hypothetical protein